MRHAICFSAFFSRSGSLGDPTLWQMPAGMVVFCYWMKIRRRPRHCDFIRWTVFKLDCQDMERSSSCTHPTEARIVERAFGLGASALAEVVQIINGRLNLNAA